jgi:proline iminopeptidase
VRQSSRSLHSWQHADEIAGYPDPGSYAQLSWALLLADIPCAADRSINASFDRDGGRSIQALVAQGSQPSGGLRRAGKLHNGEGRIAVNGILHWYRVAGAQHGGVPLIVIHGGPGGNNYNFEHTIGPRLEAFATIVYYEQRGSGRSDKPANPAAYSMALLASDLDTLREEPGIDTAVLLGYSFGGQLALEYSLAHPERVTALILEDASLDLFDERTAVTQLTGFRIVSRGELQKRIQQIASEPIASRDKLNKVWDLVNSDTVGRLLFHNASVARLNREMWDASHLSNTGDMMRALRAEPARRPPLLNELAGIRIPTLVIVGLYDHNVGVDCDRDIAAAIPGAHLVVFSRSGHFPDMEEPAKFTATVAGFLRGNASQ